jgi:hypothetical protein
LFKERHAYSPSVPYAEIMAKKMAAKLIEYKKEQGGDGWIQWELKNPTVEADLKRRLKDDYK